METEQDEDGMKTDDELRLQEDAAPRYDLEEGDPEPESAPPERDDDDGMETGPEPRGA